MADERIVLNEKSFKALSADSRVNILKSLVDRRRTLTELSQKLNLGSSTVKEHCDILIAAELIRLVDEGRKWKYYELTKKGKQIIKPDLIEEVKVLILLSLATIVVGGFVFLVLSGTNTTAGVEPMINTFQTTMSQKAIGSTTEINAATALDKASGLASPARIGIEISTEFFVASMIISVIFGMVLGWIFTRTK
jgi:DNA-binding transcriptional ArsR family regulator